MKKTAKHNAYLSTWVAAMPFLCLIIGCLPVPHTTERSAEVQGRVVDARTHVPIQGAKVFLTESPQVSTYTDADGHFHFKATRNFHLAYVPPEGDWPKRKDNYIEISHTNYLPYGFDDYMGGNMGDILLKPKP